MAAGGSTDNSAARTSAYCHFDSKNKWEAELKKVDKETAPTRNSSALLKRYLGLSRNLRPCAHTSTASRAKEMRRWLAAPSPPRPREPLLNTKARRTRTTGGRTPSVAVVFCSHNYHPGKAEQFSSVLDFVSFNRPPKMEKVG